MGGDLGPPITVPAALAALSRYPHLTIKLFGDAVRLRPLLPAQLPERLELCHAPDSVAMGDKPAQVVRSKRQSSMWLALEAVARGQGCLRQRGQYRRFDVDGQVADQNLARH